MKKKILRIIYFLLALYFLYAAGIYAKLFYCVHKSEEFQNQDFLNFIIYGSSVSDDGNTISAKFSIIDTKGNSITEIERSWNGNYLAIEFNQTEISGKYFIFPSKIFAKNRIIEGNKKRKQGTRLEKYYEDNKECILLGNNSNRESRKNLFFISQFTNKNYLVPYFGIINNYVLDLSDCENEVVYTISCNKAGKLTLHKM